jgi:hypothetical protein
VSGPAEQDWNLLIRRSFGIPDLISDQVTNERLRQVLAVDDVRQLVDSVCEAGRAGELDRFLAQLDGLSPEETAKSIVLRMDQPMSKVAAATRILEQVRHFVHRHPFKDAGGHYFGP